MSRKFRALDQLKSYCTKFSLRPLASILTRSFARLNNTTFTLSKPRTTVPTFHGLRPKQVTPPYVGGKLREVLFDFFLGGDGGPSFHEAPILSSMVAQK